MNDSTQVPVVGIVGGIGSGKSSLAREITSRRNLLLVDADSIGHNVLKQKCVIEQIRKRFGPGVLDDTGNINRRALAGAVFGLSDRQQDNRCDLESIVHPEIKKEIRRIIGEIGSTSKVEAVIVDAAVLLEAEWNDACDAVVFVHAPHEMRIERVMQRRGWTADELRRREASQLALEEKRQRSDFVIDNATTIDDAAIQFERILDSVISPQS